MKITVASTILVLLGWPPSSHAQSEAGSLRKLAPDECYFHKNMKAYIDKVTSCNNDNNCIWIDYHEDHNDHFCDRRDTWTWNNCAEQVSRPACEGTKTPWNTCQWDYKKDIGGICVPEYRHCKFFKTEKHCWEDGHCAFKKRKYNIVVTNEYEIVTDGDCVPKITLEKWEPEFSPYIKDKKAGQTNAFCPNTKPENGDSCGPKRFKENIHCGYDHKFFPDTKECVPTTMYECESTGNTDMKFQWVKTWTRKFHNEVAYDSFMNLDDCFECQQYEEYINEEYNSFDCPLESPIVGEHCDTGSPGPELKYLPCSYHYLPTNSRTGFSCLPYTNMYCGHKDIGDKGLWTSWALEDALGEDLRKGYYCPPKFPTEGDPCHLQLKDPWNCKFNDKQPLKCDFLDSERQKYKYWKKLECPGKIPTEGDSCGDNGPDLGTCRYENEQQFEQQFVCHFDSNSWMDVTCPLEIPTAEDPCGNGQNRCKYDGGYEFFCDSGVWKDAACPPGIPTKEDPCYGPYLGSCHYDNRQEFICNHSRVWEDVSCPLGIPTAGDSCSKSPSTCKYDGGYEFGCILGKWEDHSCPPKMPAEGDLCDHDHDGVQCQYKNEQDNEWEFACDKRVWWNVTCPSKMPAVSSPCRFRETPCVYDEWKEFYCEEETEVWKSDSCPPEMPSGPSACFNNGVFCRYGGSFFKCAKNKWVAIAIECPFKIPTEGDPCYDDHQKCRYNGGIQFRCYGGFWYQVKKTSLMTVP